MSANPEFTRNLWLEITPSRLVIMPVVLGAIFYLAFVTDDYRLSQTVFRSATLLFFLICMVWGTKLASESIMNEIRDHTWDGQRMSVITPWQLTWGKLLGSTVYSWYGSLICILLFGLSSQGRSPVQTVETMMVLMATGVLAHAMSLLASLMALQKERKFSKNQTTALLLLGIVVAGPFMSMALYNYGKLTWYGISFDQTDFLLCTSVSYAAWAVLGVHKLMRRELQMKNAPWAWYGFVLFLMAHLSGFFYGTGSKGGMMEAASPVFLAVFGVAVAAVYLSVFAENKELLSLQIVMRLFAARDWRRFLERAPRWLLTLPMVAVAGAAVVGTAEAGKSGGALHVAAFVAATVFFVLRDLGIVLYCNLGKQARRADLFSIVCLMLLYAIIPAILSAIGADKATLLFWPRIDQTPFTTSVITSLMEALLMALLVRERWRKRVA
jgi:hypothetical protein